ncbi:MAG: hypothetical protein M3227_01375 [Thermoproteota archaeon]|nr:hypothetical protein [Thermoproteota archaeon]
MRYIHFTDRIYVGNDESRGVLKVRILAVVKKKMKKRRRRRRLTTPKC